MRKLLLTLAVLCIVAPAQSQNWLQMKDSTDKYIQEQDFQTALKWARLVIVQAEKEFGIKDTNYLISLSALPLLYSYLSDRDSIIFYADYYLSACRNYSNDDNTFLANALISVAIYL